MTLEEAQISDTLKELIKSESSTPLKPLLYHFWNLIDLMGTAAYRVSIPVDRKLIF
jgi:hypothetical protein